MESTVHIQGGADFPHNGSPNLKRKTKSALKKAIAEDPTSVHLYDTTAPMFKSAPKFTGAANELPEDVTFNVVGPDPYTKRDWYATVTRKGDKVSCR